MTYLFALGDDGFHYLLSWLDFSSICLLDIAIGNVIERSLWLRSLHSMDNKSVDEYHHCHSSVLWLIARGARTTEIRSRRFVGRIDSTDAIADKTFAGVGASRSGIKQTFPHLTKIELGNC